MPEVFEADGCVTAGTEVDAAGAPGAGFDAAPAAGFNVTLAAGLDSAFAGVATVEPGTVFAAPFGDPFAVFREDAAAESCAVFVATLTGSR
jgi:hypothetical protein